jgi:phosphoadenosine phosphosulfate reductase
MKNPQLKHKVEYAINILKKTEKLALEMHPKGFHLAFSGGKDSLVLYHIAKMAGVKFHTHMQITTLDPPELLKFIRKSYKDVEFHRPEINFYELIKKKKMLPLRQARYCCTYLKEQAGAGTVTLTGIRASESVNRAKRNEVEISGRKYSNSLDQFNVDKERVINCVSGKDKILVAPIFQFTDNDVWGFIRGLNIEYCKLYDEGYRRIGCIFCPMASKKTKYRDRKRYPKVEAKIKESIQYLIDNIDYGGKYNANADEIFDWWCSDQPMAKYFAMLRYQTKLKF